MKYIVVALALVALASCERRTCVRTKEQEVWIWLDQYTLIPIKQTVCTQWVRVHE